MNIQSLIAIGGTEWKAGEKHRIYFNDLPALFPGLRVNNYGTGSVSSAFLNGERISNTKGREIDSCLVAGKLWFDVSDSKFYSRIESCRSFTGDEMAKTIITEIKRRAAERETPST